MRQLTDEMIHTKKRVKMFAYITLMFIPVVYLLIAILVEVPVNEDRSYDILLYIFLVGVIISPVIAIFIERNMIKQFKNKKEPEMTKAKLYTSVSLIRFGCVDFAYMAALIIYFLSGLLDYFPYFYLIGIIWSYIVWPRESIFENFMSKVETNEF